MVVEMPGIAYSSLQKFLEKTQRSPLRTLNDVLKGGMLRRGKRNRVPHDVIMVRFAEKFPLFFRGNVPVGLIRGRIMDCRHLQFWFSLIMCKGAYK